jgi:hypothetical protein
MIYAATVALADFLKAVSHFSALNGGRIFD